MAIKLEVGKTYLTRGDGKVTITSNLGEATAYPYLGYCAEAGRTLSWREDGVFDRYSAYDKYDLIKDVTEPQTPREMQLGLGALMGFTQGTRVRVVAKVEEANSVYVPWAARNMDPLLEKRAVGTVYGTGLCGSVPVRFDDGTYKHFLPQCLEHVTLPPADVKLNSDYTATVKPQSNTITVGCQDITIEAIREVVKTWEELNPDSAAK